MVLRAEKSPGNAAGAGPVAQQLLLLLLLPLICLAAFFSMDNDDADRSGAAVTSISVFTEACDVREEE